ncbi:sigma-70 family RNA polymerase sigma factor [Microbacterium sp. 3J1]|uniref:sigma-70 family RNA polymerase sigma factor n=1 Tax=Microbacterium sp. 3J1 TaxID=861269 RepID=UPI000B0F3DF4|nr:sigma-70 family RNA polymerase sigma factor [Microbacterium sp. 3J1]
MPQRARNQLVVDHLHIVGAATAHVSSRLTHVSRDDLASAGAFALVRAAEKYDASLGIPFGAFARGRIDWALKDELRSMDWAPRPVRVRARRTTKVRETLTTTLGRTPTVAEIAAAMGVDPVEVREGLADAERLILSLDAADEVEIAWTGHLPEDLALTTERDALLHRAIDALPERKRSIIRAVYFEDRTVTEIAEELGVSHAAVSQHRAEGIRMLRDALDRHYADDARVVTQRASRSSAPAIESYLERIAAGGQRLTRALMPLSIGV